MSTKNKERVCAVCKKTFLVVRPSAIGKYCSITCRNIGITKKEIHSCDYCGKEIIGRPSRFKRAEIKHIFCSQMCSAHWRSNNPMGKRISNYNNFGKKRREKLYGKFCVICGFDRCVEYAHIISVKRGGTIHPDNIVCLCPNHHTLYDNDLLTDEEQLIMNSFIIQAWGSEKSAIFKNNKNLC